MSSDHTHDMTLLVCDVSNALCVEFIDQSRCGEMCQVVLMGDKNMFTTSQNKCTNASYLVHKLTYICSKCIKVWGDE